MAETTTVLEEAFDVANEEGSSDYELLPAGRYRAEIRDARIGPTKNGRGRVVKLQWQITEGEYENRLIFQSVLTQHESEEAQKFGRQRLKDICEACGVREKLTDLTVLLHKPCSVQVAIRKDPTGQYADQNEIKRVRPAISGWNGARGSGTRTVPDPDDLNDPIPF